MSQATTTDKSSKEYLATLELHVPVPFDPARPFQVMTQVEGIDYLVGRDFYGNLREEAVAMSWLQGVSRWPDARLAVQDAMDIFEKLTAQHPDKAVWVSVWDDTQVDGKTGPLSHKREEVFSMTVNGNVMNQPAIEEFRCYFKSPSDPGCGNTPHRLDHATKSWVCTKCGRGNYVQTL